MEYRSILRACEEFVGGLRTVDDNDPFVAKTYPENGPVDLAPFVVRVRWVCAALEQVAHDWPPPRAREVRGMRRRGRPRY